MTKSKMYNTNTLLC